MLCWAVLQGVLQDVVSIWVHGQEQGLGNDLLHNWLKLRPAAALQHPLQDAAAKAVPSHLCNSPRPTLEHLVKNELRGLRPQGCDAALHHVVRVGAADRLPHVAPELCDQGELHLHILATRLERGLDPPATLWISGE